MPHTRTPNLQQVPRKGQPTPYQLTGFMPPPVTVRWAEAGPGRHRAGPPSPTVTRCSGTGQLWGGGWRLLPGWQPGLYLAALGVVGKVALAGKPSGSEGLSRVGVLRALQEEHGW